MLSSCRGAENINEIPETQPKPVHLIMIDSEASPKKDVLNNDNPKNSLEGFPRLYLILDPAIPPYNSQLISIDLNLILSGNLGEVDVISADSEFLGRDPYLTWAPDKSKAVFVNRNGVYIFDPETKQFTKLPDIPFHQTSVHWNVDSLRFAMVVENGKQFSSDVILMDSQSGLIKSFNLDAYSVPAVLGWKDNQTLIVSIKELYLPADTQKLEVTKIGLFALDIGNGYFTEILPDKNWLNTEVWDLSPDGKALVFREFMSKEEDTLVYKTQIIDLTTLEVRELITTQGIIEWFNLEDIVAYNMGFGEEDGRLTWIKKWLEIQSIGIERSANITEVLVAPDGKSMALFLSTINTNTGIETGYKAFIITQAGQEKDFMIPGISSSDWVVRFAAWGQ